MSRGIESQKFGYNENLDVIKFLNGKEVGEYGISIYGWRQDDWNGVDYTNENNRTEYSSLKMDYNSHLLYPGFYIIKPFIDDNGNLCVTIPTIDFSNKKNITITSPRLINLHNIVNGRVEEKRFGSFRL